VCKQSVSGDPRRLDPDRPQGSSPPPAPSCLRGVAVVAADRCSDRAILAPKSARGTASPRLGLTLAPANEIEGAGNRGVAITAVDPNGPAAEHGIQIGDVILEIAGKPVSKAEDVRDQIAALYMAGRSTVVLRVKSGDATKFVAVPFGKV
jgi:S1-C subfamily serine protease